MTRSTEPAGVLRWGWRCPRCDEDATVSRDPSTDTYRWECPDEDCRAVGFGFSSRRRARIALGEFRERSRKPYR